ncbi:hypothetical protein [Novosphingobium sp. JCM 18896]|uniref:hypothetical protein n=1 Tax=Novosphingobium sp. JCM 18896 TaxID=2989731 RepID=UPI002221F001|nr:hypothetical protein [Novosphingobium sp. JCM 18896]MCW1430853.1 hypothetical protein [Novosphingobium sp. JCM 18896]
MRKAEAEKAVRFLTTKWFKEMGRPETPHFSDFVSWLRLEGYSHYLDFRSTMGAQEDAESWFDQELRPALRR